MLCDRLFTYHTRAECVLTESTVLRVQFIGIIPIEALRATMLARTHVYFSFYCCARNNTFRSHTRITSIDSRKPPTINYVKNVCKENGKTGTHTPTHTNVHTYLGDDTLD